ncbi:MAG: hypothetical protein AAF225_11685 [Pseudomonadota bacterium]
MQLANRAYFPFGDAKDDWAILRALSERIGKTLPYDDLYALRQAMIEDSPSFGSLDTVEAGEAPRTADWAGAGSVTSEPFKAVFDNYYFTNPVARASDTMAECAESAQPVKPLIAAE